MYDKNPSPVRERARCSYRDNPSPVRKRVQDSYKKNPAFAREKARKSYRENPTSIRERVRKSYRENPSPVRERVRESYRGNPSPVREKAPGNTLLQCVKGLKHLMLKILLQLEKDCCKSTTVTFQFSSIDHEEHTMLMLNQVDTSNVSVMLTIRYLP